MKRWPYRSLKQLDREKKRMEQVSRRVGQSVGRMAGRADGVQRLHMPRRRGVCRRERSVGMQGDGEVMQLGQKLIEMKRARLLNLPQPAHAASTAATSSPSKEATKPKEPQEQPQTSVSSQVAHTRKHRVRTHERPASGADMRAPVYLRSSVMSGDVARP